VPDCGTLTLLSEWRKRFDDFVTAARDALPNCWISEVKKMRDVLGELKTMKARKKKLA